MLTTTTNNINFVYHSSETLTKVICFWTHKRELPLLNSEELHNHMRWCEGGGQGVGEYESGWKYSYIDWYHIVVHYSVPLEI